MISIISLSAISADLYLQNDNCTMKDQIIKIRQQSSAVYGLGFIGSLIYFIQHAQTFWQGALAFVKALIWPALLIYHLLEHLKI